ncbi:MAG: Uma2 family endonuclease [Microcoleaceae cyanobacterium]
MTQNLIPNTKKYPPLENGDRLAPLEFERRYNQMPDVKKAELIKGIVYMPAALRYKQHGRPHSHIMTWLGNYEAVTPGVECADNATVRLDENNIPQPDALLRITNHGQSTISEDDYIEGSPELIVEIAASTVSIDSHDKLKVYCHNQVQEYLVWRVYDQEFDWFRLGDGEYIKLIPDVTGIMKSEIYPGLWLDVNALLTGNLAQVLTVLQAGIKTPEHEIFVQKLSIQ